MLQSHAWTAASRHDNRRCTDQHNQIDSQGALHVCTEHKFWDISIHERPSTVNHLYCTSEGAPRRSNVDAADGVDAAWRRARWCSGCIGHNSWNELRWTARDCGTGCRGVDAQCPRRITRTQATVQLASCPAADQHGLRLLLSYLELFASNFATTAEELPFGRECIGPHCIVNTSGAMPRQ